MIRKEWLGVTAVAALLLSGTVSWARDLEEILKDKGVLSDKEAAEAKTSEEAGKTKAPAPPALPEWLQKLTLLGDVRIRNESFFRDGDPDRNRQRFRLRFGAKLAINELTELGFRLASGNPNDPISNNQTFTDAFTPKSINVNTAYLKLTPAKALSLPPSLLTFVGGKFETPTYRPTPLLFDADVTPEGFYEALKPIDEKTGFLRSIQLNLGQWIYQENTKTGDGVVYVFQGVTGLALLDNLTATLAAGDYKFNKASTIAVARNKNTSLVITDRVRLSDGTVVGGKSVDPAKAGPNKDGLDANGKPIKIAGFVSDFNIVNAGGDLTLDTGLPRWPLRLFGDYVLNTEARSGDDSGFQVGAGIGASEDAGDLSFAYAYERLETDAVISPFADSEFGDAGTNNKGHVLQVGYVLVKGLQFVSSAYIVEPIDDVSGRSDKTFYRWQVDFIAKF